MTILDQIALRKTWERAILRDALAGRSPAIDEGWMPDAEVLSRAASLLDAGGAAPSGRSLREALHRSERLTVIAEVKRRSPSAGRISPWQDPEPLASAYAAGGADALSVLTDAAYFDGRPGFLPRCRGVFAGPVLRKDFLEDELDLAVSAALGADAVLLITSRLGAGLADLLPRAQDYGLEALVEVHDEHELELALSAGASIVGVNNRDLRRFVTDLGVTERLAPRVPADVVLVAESGIRGPQDARRMREAGADALLVGESLARAAGDGLPALQSALPRGARP